MEELEEALSEQVQFLTSSAESFDSGFEGEAKRLAVTIRVLLHDSKSSRSLLGQLSRKSTQFLDTCNPSGSDAPFCGLVVVNLKKSGRFFAAPLDNVSGETRTPFETWWTRTVLMDDRFIRMSRRDLILTAADQDGGAHVDPTLDETYARISCRESLRWYRGGEEGPKPILGAGPEKAAIRQIAHEVLRTLSPRYRKPMVQDGGIYMQWQSVKIRQPT